MRTFMRALRALGLDRDLDRLAADDDLGRKLQDLELFGPRHNAAQPGTQKRLPNNAAFSAYSQAFFALKDGLEQLFQCPVDLLTPDALRNPYLHQRVEAEQVSVYVA
jgi:hypothetical protein